MSGTDFGLIFGPWIQKDNDNDKSTAINLNPTMKLKPQNSLHNFITYNINSLAANV